MLNHGILKYDALGRVRCTLDPPIYFNGGTPIAANGLLSLTNLDPVVFLAGFGFATSTTGSICSEQGINPDNNGPIVGRNGKARTTPDAPVFWYCGLPFGPDSNMSIVVEGPPPVPQYAFDEAFDTAFNTLAAPSFGAAVAPGIFMSYMLTVASWWHNLRRRLR